MFFKHPLGAYLAPVCLALLILMPTATDLAAQGQSASEGEHTRAEKDVTKNMTLVPRAKRRHQSEPNIYLPDCGQPKDHNQADLCEQMRMAKATEDAVNVAWKQYVVSILGLAGLIATVWFTGRAAVAASRSAQAAERALVDLERPHVFVELTRAGIGLKPVAGSGLRFTTNGLLTYSFMNYGRTPARLLDITRRFPVVSRSGTGMPEPLPPDGPPDRTLPIGIAVAEGHPYKETENPRVCYGAIWYEDNAPLNFQLFFMGRIRYADIFDRTYVAGFCFLYDSTWHRFVRIGDERYNYARRET